MITIRINQASETDLGISPQWIKEQIQNRRKDGSAICVLFEINCTEMQINLSFGQCPSGNGGGRAPNKREEQLIEEWRRVKDRELNPGLIISFWQHVKKACR